jgi:hypothetical protein
MLADLGLSHFSAVVEGNDQSTRDGRGGSQAYCMMPTLTSYATADWSCTGAPERNLDRGWVDHFQPRVKQNVDTWSLACVYSEHQAWVQGGYEGPYGLSAYREKRSSHENIDPALGACFHDKNGGLLPVVEEWHKESLELCATQDHVSPIIWNDLLRRMFAHSSTRLDARQALADSQEVVGSARGRLQDPKARYKPNSMSPTPQVDSPPKTPPDVPKGYGRSSSRDVRDTYPSPPFTDHRNFSNHERARHHSRRQTGGSSDNDVPSSPLVNPGSSSAPQANEYISGIGLSQDAWRATDEHIHGRQSGPWPGLTSSFNAIGLIDREQPVELIQGMQRSSTMQTEQAGFSRMSRAEYPHQESNGGRFPIISRAGTSLEERQADERHAREEQNKAPERHLSVRELQEWARVTHVAPKTSWPFYRKEQEIPPLPYEDELLPELKRRDHVSL